MTFGRTLTVALLLAAPALAQADSAAPGMIMKGAHTPATVEATKAMEKMHKSMMAPYTGDPDVDFVSQMMPHHQGAIDMARIELKYGKDPDLRTMAEAVIQAQEAEIKQMKDWLTAHGK